MSDTSPHLQNPFESLHYDNHVVALFSMNTETGEQLPGTGLYEEETFHLPTAYLEGTVYKEVHQKKYDTHTNLYLLTQVKKYII